MAGPIGEKTIEVDGVEVLVRSTGGEGTPAVFAHGNPTDSRDWIPFLERLERPGIAFDMPGWGRSARPHEFDYSMRGQSRFFRRVLEQLGVAEHALLVHDWGSLALIDAPPDLTERLVVVNAVPFLPGYRWHRLARVWRAPLAGSILNRAVGWRPVQRLIRRGDPEGRRLPEHAIAQLIESWTATSSTAMVRLYRSGDPEALAAAGVGLGRLECPALVVWGSLDPYIPKRFARAYAERLPGAELVELADAGHWPWIERSELVDRTVEFLDRGRDGG